MTRPRKGERLCCAHGNALLELDAARQLADDRGLMLRALRLPWLAWTVTASETHWHWRWHGLGGVRDVSMTVSPRTGPTPEINDEVREAMRVSLGEPLPAKMERTLVQSVARDHRNAVDWDDAPADPAEAAAVGAAAERAAADVWGVAVCPPEWHGDARLWSVGIWGVSVSSGRPTNVVATVNTEAIADAGMDAAVLAAVRDATADLRMNDEQGET